MDPPVPSTAPKITSVKRAQTSDTASPRFNSDYWSKRIERELYTKRGDKQEGPWKAGKPGAYSVPEKVFRKFYQWPKDPTQDLLQRQEYATWIIDQALGDFPQEGDVNTYDNRLGDELVSYTCAQTTQTDKTQDKSKIKESEGAVFVTQANSRFVPGLSLHSTEEEQTQSMITQSVEAVAQAWISASPNCLGPPIEACATYLQMHKIAKTGPDDVDRWISPSLFEVHKEEDSDRFFNSQITAITWILSRFFGKLPKLKEQETPHESQTRKKLRGPHYEGAILADSMGLGKTLIAVATLELMASKKLNIMKEYAKGSKQMRKRERHCPMLILCPNPAVACQWVESLLKIKSSGGISTIIVSGGTSNIYPEDVDVHYLSLNDFMGWDEDRKFQYVWNPTKEKASKTVIVVPIHAWASRTCMTSTEERLLEYTRKQKNIQKQNLKGSRTQSTKERRKNFPKEVINNRGGGDDEEERQNEDIVDNPGHQDLVSTFTRKGRCFSVVVVDEAHKVKNASTRLFQSVELIKRRHTLLITATPCTNTLSDLLGPARLLWQTPEQRLMKENTKVWQRIKNITRLADLSQLDCVQPWNDLQLAAGRPDLLSRLVCKTRQNEGQQIDETRLYLRFFESLAILRRSPKSIIFSDWEQTKPVSLKGLFPVVRTRTVDLEMNGKLAEEYQMKHVDLLIDYITEGLTSRRTKEEKLKNSKHLITIRRQWQIASSSMDVLRLDRLTEKVQQKLDSEEGIDAYSTPLATKSADIQQWRRNGVTFLHLAEFTLPSSNPKPRTALEYLKGAIQGSPTLRYILYDIRHNVLKRSEDDKFRKLLIVEAIPIVAYYYELVLQFLGLNARTFHAGLEHAERRDLIDSFNSDDDESCQILIQMYTVDFAGTNLHKNCSRVLVAAQAHSIAMELQATHRIIRFGQTQDVEVQRIKVRNTYHAFQESRQVEKMLPELGARAQGVQNEVLVLLLNLAQEEVEELWRSEQGQKLLHEKSLLSDAESSRLTRSVALAENTILSTGADTARRQIEQDEEHVNKKRRLATDTAGHVTVATIRYHHGNTSSEEANANHPRTDSSIVSRKEGNSHDSSAARDDRNAGWFLDQRKNGLNPLEAFLELQPRDKYYSEFKALPEKTRSHFDHDQNQRRRLLSYSRQIRGPREWTIQDLDNPAVLERAIELLLRIRLGTGNIEMLPIPSINFSAISERKLGQLRRCLAKLDTTEQDLGALEEMIESEKALEGLTEPSEETGRPEDWEEMGLDAPWSTKGGESFAMTVREIEMTEQETSNDTNLDDMASEQSGNDEDNGENKITAEDEDNVDDGSDKGDSSDSTRESGHANDDATSIKRKSDLSTLEGADIVIDEGEQGYAVKSCSHQIKTETMPKNEPGDDDPRTLSRDIRRIPEISPTSLSTALNYESIVKEGKPDVNESIPSIATNFDNKSENAGTEREGSGLSAPTFESLAAPSQSRCPDKHIKQEPNNTRDVDEMELDSDMEIIESRPVERVSEGQLHSD